MVRDTLALATEAAPDGTVELLAPRVTAGEANGPHPSLEASRAHALASLDGLPGQLHGFDELSADEAYQVAPSRELSALLERVRQTKI
jgi:hypothetical protein